MTNAIPAIEANLPSNVLLISRSIGRRANSSTPSGAKTLQRDRASRAIDQSLVRGLLDPKSSSLSIKALVRAAAFSGKRLVLEIRDENPVRIVRTSTRGM